MSWVKTRIASARGLFGLVALAPILLLAVLLLLAPPDGGERTQFLQFVGRFHPISVHLPIALLMLIPLLELAGRTRYFAYLLASIDFLLGTATLGAIGAAMLGWSLGRNGGYSGPLVTQHMWGGVAVAAAAWLCWFLRAQAVAGGRQRLYVLTLLTTVGIVSFTGYRGGQLSQGENHLTEFMPEPLQSVLGVSASEPVVHSGAGGPETFFGARIQPLFANHCTSCHGRNKHKGKLRLDSFDALMRGGKHGAVVKANETKASELFRRITLPPTDDEFMPTDGKRPLSASDVKLIELWITSGASGTQAVDAIKDLPASSTSQVAEVTFDEVDLEAVAKQRESLAAVVTQLQQRFPRLLDYQSRSSADLVINASLLGLKFGDNELAALAPLSERIVGADLSNTAITDRSAGALSTMKHLRELRLMHTKISDATVQALGGLDQLESLSLFDTPVTSANLPVVARLPKLRHVYVAGTRISPDATLPPEIKSKIVF